jgi:hypothetical protein
MEQVIHASPNQHDFPLITKDSRSERDLTDDSLFWLNLESRQNQSPGSSTSTPEAISSSTSSLNSFDTDSDDHKHALSTFYNASTAASNSSLATLVQKLAESTTTLNLDSRLKTNYDTVLPSTPPLNRPSGPRKTKSALKLPSLSRSKSMPDANIAVKTVRFSNDLTSVKTFNEHAKPSSISLDNSPEISPCLFDERLGSSSSPKAFFELKNSFSSSSSGSSSDEEEEEDYFNHRTRSNFSRWTFKALNFDLFLIKNLVDKPVKLSSLQIVNNHSIHGTVEVSNLAFEKYVEVKFTTDNWQSIYLVTGKFERSLNSFKDQFTFDIELNKSLLMNSHYNASNDQQVDVGVCIKYVSDGCNEFYDNNNSRNYQFQLINKPRQRKLRTKGLNSTKQSSQLTNNFTTSSSSSSPSVSSASLPSSASSNTSRKPPATTSTSTSTRYFPDDTDYFNTQSVTHPKFNDWLKTSSVIYSSASATSSTAPSTSSSSSSVSTSTLTLPRVKTPIDLFDGANVENDSPDEKYNQFLKKYCFFKPDGLRE